MSDYYPLTGKNLVMSRNSADLVNLEKLTIEEEPKSYAEESLKVSVTNWKYAIRKLLNQEVLFGFKRRDEDPQEAIFSNEGLINEFARLKTPKDIILFSNKYGLLGIKEPEARQIHSPFRAVQRTVKPSFIFNDYGFSVFEPLELWLWHINEVRQILNLYDVVKKNSSEDRVNQLISVNSIDGESGNPDEEIYYVKWGARNEQIVLLPKGMEEKPMLEIGQYTISKILQRHISRGIHLDTGDLVRNPSTKGFKIIEQRYTPYLLAAIYYDLWKNINDDKNIYICGNPSCGLPFVKTRRKKYCSDSCKQEAYRKRIKNK